SFLDGRGLAQIERDAALVGIDREEGRRHLALGPFAVDEQVTRLVALVRLDLDHVGAEQRELIGAVRSRQIPREVEDTHAGERLHTASRLALATALISSNSRRRSAICWGVIRSRFEKSSFHAASSRQRSGDCTVVRAAGADSSTRNASSSVSACDSTSKGRPALLPSGKSLKRKRGTPQYSTMSLAQPMTTVGRPLASRWRATRLTVWWQT